MQREDREASFETETCLANSRCKIFGCFQFLFYKVWNHFRIGFGNKRVTFLLEFVADLPEVFDDAVVNHRDGLVTTQMRMRVFLRDAAVRRPARVCDGQRTFFIELQSVHFADLPDVFFYQKPITNAAGDSPGVVPAVLQILQPFHHQCSCIFPGAHIPEYSAHRCHILAENRSSVSGALWKEPEETKTH